MEEKLWKKHELRSPKDERSVTWKKCRDCFQAKTGVGCDGFHPTVLFNLTKRDEGRNCGVPGEGGAEWKVAATSMHNDVLFLIPKNVTSERPIALMPTLIRWWEALRAQEVTKWQLKYRSEWDATHGRYGAAQQTVWEILLEMDRFYGKAKEEDQGASALVLDLAKAFERVSLHVVWGNALPKEDLASAVRYSEHQRRVQFEGCAARAAHDHHGYPARAEVELLALTDCVAGCAKEVTKITLR